MPNRNGQIEAAIDVLDLNSARELLKDALKENPDAETYYLASKVALDNDQKREFLEKAIALDPFFEGARSALKTLKTPLQSVSSAEVPSTVLKSNENHLLEERLNKRLQELEFAPMIAAMGWALLAIGSFIICFITPFNGAYTYEPDKIPGVMAVWFVISLILGTMSLTKWKNAKAKSQIEAAEIKSEIRRLSSGRPG